MKKLLALLLIISFPLTSFGAVYSFVGMELQSLSEGDSVQGTGNSIDTTLKYDGTASYKSKPVTSATPRFTMGEYSADGTSGYGNTNDAYYTYHIYITTLPASGMESFMDGRNVADNVKIRYNIDNAGNVGLYAGGTTIMGTSTVAITTGAWHCIQARISASDSVTPNVYSFAVDGVTGISGTYGPGLGTSDNAKAAFGKTVNNSGQSYEINYDDMIASNSGFESCNDLMVLYTPDANGSNSAWNEGTGASDYQEVDENPVDTTTYIKTSSITYNTLSSFGMTNFAPLASSFSAVSAHTIVRDETGTAQQFLYVKSGATVATTTQLDPTVNYTLKAKHFATDPNTSSAWTLAGINALEVGVGVGTGSVVPMRASEVAYQILYVPSTAVTRPLFNIFDQFLTWVQINI